VVVLTAIAVMLGLGDGGLVGVVMMGREMDVRGCGVRLLLRCFIGFVVIINIFLWVSRRRVRLSTAGAAIVMVAVVVVVVVIME
jgi:hypothetical protein